MEHLAKSSACRTVVGVVRKESDAVALRAKLVSPSSSKIHILLGDVTSLASLETVAAEVEKLGIVPDLLLVNAGVLTEPQPFYMIPQQDMQYSFEVNVLGAHNAMTAFLRRMRHVEGAVMVNMSSAMGLRGYLGQGSYCASKHALEGLVKCAAMEVESDPLAIVTVRPGMVATDMLVTSRGSAEAAEAAGTPLELFVPQFCDKIMAITKAQSGTHIDCSFKDNFRD